MVLLALVDVLYLTGTCRARKCTESLHGDRVAAFHVAGGVFVAHFELLDWGWRSVLRWRGEASLAGSLLGSGAGEYIEVDSGVIDEDGRFSVRGLLAILI